MSATPQTANASVTGSACEAPSRKEPVRLLETVVFWWLVGMGLTTLAMAALVPALHEYQAMVAVRNDLYATVRSLRQQIRRNASLIDTYKSDVEAIEQLAITDLRYHRPCEAPALPARGRGMVLPPISLQSRRHIDMPGQQPTVSGHNLNDPLLAWAAKWPAARGLLKILTDARLQSVFLDDGSRRLLVVAAMGLVAAAMVLFRPHTVPPHLAPESDQVH